MERKKVINNLMSDGALYRCDGIIKAAKENLADAEVVKALKRLKNDPVIVFGRAVAWYATAALDFIGAEKYSGDDPDLSQFIKEFPDLLAIA